MSPQAKIVPKSQRDAAHGGGEIWRSGRKNAGGTGRTEGYVRHPADVPPDATRFLNWYSQKRELTEGRADAEWLDDVACHILQNAAALQRDREITS